MNSEQETPTLEKVPKPSLSFSQLIETELKTEKDCFTRIADLLEEETLPVNRSLDEILNFLVSVGLILVPKIRGMIVYALHRAQRKEIIRMIVKACRGGGKTFSIAAGIEFTLFYFFNYDAVNLGGSKAQAIKAYEIIYNLVQHPMVQPNIKSITTSGVKKKNDTWISVLATSSTSVRSPHPGSVGKGGLLFIDEECEIKDPNIVKSAKPVVNTADPSAIIRSSTQHKLDDTFEEAWDNAKKEGYERFQWDIFDVCQHCTRKCYVSFEKDPVNGCYDGLRKDTYDVNGVVIKKGYCKGKAHHDGWTYECDKNGSWTKHYGHKSDWKGKIEGWVKIEEIFQGYIENDSETFEIEYLGRKAKRKGKVYDSSLIDKAELEALDIPFKLFRQLPKSIGIDWGYSGETCVTYSFYYAKKIYIYWIEFYTRQNLDYIIECVRERSKTDNHEEAYGDAEGAFENAQLQDHLIVYSIAFAQWKDFGVKNARNMLEKERIQILKYWQGEENPGYTHWLEQMRAYRLDRKSTRLKLNDHGPDAILCNLLKWAPKKEIGRAHV